jgi:pimeloyl-ACP methyl ester carboxylesterase
MPAPRDRTPVLFLHGFWHGSWCWTEVLAGLTGAGAEVSPVAGGDLDQAGDLLVTQVKQLGAGAR